MIDALKALYTAPATAKAHCDVPCGIYDPIDAQLAAVTVIRVFDLLADMAEHDTLSMADQAQLSRLVAQKEEHAEKVKHQVRIIWGDYFKADQIAKFPGVHALVHDIMMTGSKCKQTMDRDNAIALLDKVNEFATMFWQTKGFEVKHVASPYPVKVALVAPVLADA
ncbi:MAG: superoxide dismutase, Ni [Pseudomonadota bacterium]